MKFLMLSLQTLVASLLLATMMWFLLGASLGLTWFVCLRIMFVTLAVLGAAVQLQKTSEKADERIAEEVDKRRRGMVD